MFAEGWARRVGVSSIVFHYFRGGVSLCPRRWPRPVTSLLLRVTDGICCPACVARRVEPH